jgi:hypothetical protein
MATSRTPPLALCLVGIAIAGGGCGRSAGAPRTAAAAPAFAWLRPTGAPQGWLSARLSDGATLAYPHGWRIVHGDRGTVTAALLDGHGDYRGYLNLTPRQGDERQSNWRAFRPRHNAAEGERDVTLQAGATGLRFRTGQGACVQDAYTTAEGTRYVELACLVGAGRGESVVVGAAPSSEWALEGHVIERAISALGT